MSRPNRRLQLEQSYTATDNPSEFKQKIKRVTSKVGESETLLHRGFADNPDKFDTEEFVTFTVDGFPEDATKKTFDVNIERAPSSDDKTLFRVEIEWFGVNTEDISEMEERGVEIMQNIHDVLESNFRVESPKGDFVVPSDQGL